MEEFWDIKDEESLRVWLESQPQRYSVVIAHRVAMRMLPVYWGHVVPTNEFRESDLDIMPILRASLLSGAGAYSPEIEGNPDLIHAAILAAFRAPSNSTLTHTADDGVISVVSSPLIPAIVKSSENSAYAAALSASAPTLIQAADAAAVAAHAAMVSLKTWGLINKDCSLLVDGENLSYWTLWAEGLNYFKPEWEAIKAGLAKDDIDWSFWIKWYEAALSGTPLPWALLERVALEVKEGDWENGPLHVNRMIAEIELDFAVKATPNAELIVVNGDGKYASIPRSGLPSKTLGDTNERISDVVVYIRNSQKNSNQYSPLLPEADFLEGQLERYGDNALRLHEACAKVVIHVLRFVVAGSLPENDNVVGDVVSDLQNTADDIYNLDEEARTTLDARERLRYDRLSGEQKADAVRIAKAIADQSTKELGEEMVEDGAAIAGEIEPTEETKSNRYRYVSRVVKIIAIGGAGLLGITTALSQAEPAVGGATYLWNLIAPLLGL